MPNKPVEMTEELMQKCKAAESYLQQPLFIEMFEVMEQQYIAMWKTATDTDSREKAWFQLQALYDVHMGFQILAEKKQVWEKQQEEKEAKSRFRVVS